jgi:hypothetical protein
VKKFFYIKSYFALTISILAVDVSQPITALLQGLPEESARACVQHQLPVDATEVLLAILRISEKNIPFHYTKIVFTGIKCYRIHS